MQIKLDSLVGQSVEQLKNYYSHISTTHIAIEINDLDHAPKFASVKAEKRKSEAINSLIYIARQVRTVVLAGNYVNDIKDISDSDEPMPYLINVLKVSNEVSNIAYYLPSTVCSLGVRFCYGGSRNIQQYDIRALVRLISLLPASITELDLSQTDLHHSEEKDLVELFKSIPSTVKTLHLTIDDSKKLAHVAWAIPRSVETLSLVHCQLFNQHNITGQVLSALNPSLKALSFMGNAIKDIRIPKLATFFKSLVKLETLNLSQCDLGQLNSDSLQTLFANLPPNLKKLNISDNNFSSTSLTPTEFIDAFQRIPTSIMMLDLSKNSFLNHLSTSVWNAFLPKGISTLQVFEELGAISINTLERKLSQLPAFVTTFSLANIDLLAPANKKLLAALIYLPVTVTALDLSNTALNQKTSIELASFFQNIPSSIKKLILKQNYLAYASPAILRKGFAGLAPSVAEIDLSENGFDTLLGSQFKDCLDFIPDGVSFTLDQDKFRVKNDGELMALPRQSSFFKPAAKFHHQKQFASLRLVMLQMMMQYHWPADITIYLLSFLIPPARFDANHIRKQLEVKLLPSNLPLLGTSAIQRECINVVGQRISALAVGASELNLSRCGLNRLDNIELFRSIFKNIPKKVSYLNLRGNGFQFNEQTLEVFIAMLKEIPKNIDCLDLSDHGFEYYDATELTNLLINLPQTVRFIVLGQEKPLTLEEQLGKRQWPAHYQTLTCNATTVMNKARVLLADYTKDNSAFWRFLTGHWNRHHIKEVSEIVMSIEKGLINNLTDLFYELDKVDKSNEAGSLSRRFSFLLQSAWQLEGDEALELEQNELLKLGC